MCALQETACVLTQADGGVYASENATCVCHKVSADLLNLIHGD